MNATMIAKRILAAALSTGGVCLGAVTLAPGLAAAAAESSAVSANWAGYAVTGAVNAARFSRVAGSWVQPAGTCTQGQETYAVTWVGLGGFKQGARALEQDGTAVDCGRSGRAAYSAWFELVPAAPVTMRLKVHPGDRITASVAQKASKTILQVRDQTTGVARTTVRTVSAPDLSSAEWIVEAPSLCFTSTHCSPLPLTNFGTVSFSGASVSSNAQSNRTAIDARSLKVTRLELRDYSTGAGRRFTTSATPTSGIASPLSASGNAFTVTWGELAGEGAAEGSEEGSAEAPSQPQAPPMPGFTSSAASIRR
jgi:Peptidase A4 family